MSSLESRFYLYLTALLNLPEPPRVRPNPVCLGTQVNDNWSSLYAGMEGSKLPQRDGGRSAWLFLSAAVIVEGMLYGNVSQSSHPLFSLAKNAR